MRTLAEDRNFASITVQVGWCMGHRLPNHEGKCFNLHGHQYTAEATVTGNVVTTAGIPTEGMVMDFTDIKNELKVLAEFLDHKFLISNTDPLAPLMINMPGIVIVDFIPTAENIGLYLLKKLPSSVTSLRIWETPTSFATVERNVLW